MATVRLFTHPWICLLTRAIMVSVGSVVLPLHESADMSHVAVNAAYRKLATGKTEMD